MPKKRERPGVQPIYAELPAELAEALRARAEADRRDLKQVLILALEQYLGTKPPPEKGKK